MKRFSVLRVLLSRPPLFVAPLINRLPGASSAPTSNGDHDATGICNPASQPASQLATYRREIKISSRACCWLPMALHSSSAPPPLVVHSRMAPFSTFPSAPDEAMYRPPVLGSTLRPTTGPGRARSCTAGWGRLGVHNDTTPFW